MTKATSWALAGFFAGLIFQASIMAGVVITVATAVVGAFQ